MSPSTLVVPGQPLRATSIHVRRTVTTVKSVLLRGTVTGLSSGKVEIANGTKSLSVATDGSTTYELGTAPIRPSDVRIGDLVSIRAIPTAGGYRAERVHIYVSSRAVHTLRGTVVSVRSGTLSLKTSAGSRWQVELADGAHVRRSGRAAALSSAQPGDTATVRGQERPGNKVVAQEVDITPRVIPIVTVRGRIVSVQNGVLLIVDAHGIRQAVRAARGVRPLLHGTPAPASALFPGAHVSARGRRTGSTLIATSITLSVTARSLDGRVDRVWRTGLAMRSHSSTDIRVDFAPGMQAQDGSHKFAPGSVHVGAYVLLDGYEEDSGGVWGTSIRLQHPFVDLTGLVVTAGNSPTIQTSTGERYALKFPKGAQLSVTRYDLTVQAADVPAQTHMHIGGTVASDGSIAVSSATVTLHAEIIEGTVASLTSRALSVPTAGGPVNGRLIAGTTVTQGSHDSSVADLVVGDSVTVHGLILAGSVLLVRTWNCTANLSQSMALCFSSRRTASWWTPARLTNE